MFGEVKPSYLQKIKTRDELAKAIGKRPRQRTVIMCHGVFDIVHPGHVRHLTFAKGKADLLIASLTADEHIAKANHRPYVPQDIRAVNLAAMEMVDYVVVDTNPTPIDNIRFIKPDYFAKGYEYFSDGLPPRTQEELKVLEEYGGEMVFTPGDIVYSSSALIESRPPKLAVEKLMTLMESERMSFEHLRVTLRAMKGVRVHVVGDTIVDSYSYCSLLGATAKSPTFSVKHDQTDTFCGGAAVVAKHMKFAGARVSFSTVLGDDALRDFVLQDMKESEIQCFPVIDRTRPTTQKERFIASGYKLLQVDRVDNRSVTEKALKSLGESTHKSGADVTVFSDFRHGIFNRSTIGVLREYIPAGALRVADSQVSNRWGNILDFANFDLITPNEREARFALGDQDSVVRPLALELYRQSKCKNLILKLGERGILSYRSGGENPRDFFILDSFVDKLVDPIGAGDALLAYSSLALSVSGNPVAASILGDMAAAVACERAGNIPVSPADVDRKLSFIERQALLEG